MQRIWRPVLVTAVMLGLVVALGGAARAGSAHRASFPCGWRSTAPATYQHVIWIWEENTSYDQIVGSDQAPVFNASARACGLAANYHGLYHPSFLNYIEATSGQTGALPPSCNPSPSCQATWPSIFDQVSGAGGQWRVYAESMEQNCQLTDSTQTPVPSYVAHHNPALYYPAAAADCARWDVPLGTPASGAFVTDLARNQLPAFAFIEPNTAHNMNATAIAAGDTYLGELLADIVISPEYLSGRTAVFVTFDEGSGGTALRCADTPDAPDCHLATLVIAPSIRPGTTVSTRFDHDALLRTTEDLLGLGSHLGNAAGAPSMRPDFGF